MFRLLGMEKILINHCECVDVFLWVEGGEGKGLQIWTSPLFTTSWIKCSHPILHVSSKNLRF